MKAKITRIEWRKGDVYLEQGVKGGYTPRGAVAGSNGSFIVAGSHSELVMKFATEDGKKYAKNIIRKVKELKDWKKLSDKRYDKLEKGLVGKTIEVEEKDGKIKINSDTLNKMIKDV
jgi:hypothetical protein